MLISYAPQRTASASGLWIALVAGCGFGGFFVLIAQTQEAAVFWPLVAARAMSVATLSILMVIQRRAALPTSEALLPIMLAGIFDAGGNACFVLAEQAGRLDIASTLSSLYPVSTVVLALILLRERISWVQGAGVALALAAIPLIAQ
jgi:drug/metabolite transporter (DMT)-like permease